MAQEIEGMNGLRDIIPELDKRFRSAVEVRDSSCCLILEFQLYVHQQLQLDDHRLHWWHMYW
jgi:hypothetical protein